MTEAQGDTLIGLFTSVKAAVETGAWLAQVAAICVAILVGLCCVGFLLAGLIRGGWWAVLLGLCLVPSASFAQTYNGTSALCVFNGFSSNGAVFGELSGSIRFTITDAADAMNHEVWELQFAVNSASNNSYMTFISAGGTGISLSGQALQDKFKEACCNGDESCMAAKSMFQCAVVAHYSNDWSRFYQALHPEGLNDSVNDFNCGTCGGSGGPLDTDGDGIPDHEDTDDDNDGYSDDEDPCDLDATNSCDEAQEDTDGDGTNDWLDEDDDNDGLDDDEDPCPLDEENSCNDCATQDLDEDGCNDCIDANPRFAGPNDCGQTNCSGQNGTNLGSYPDCDYDGDGCKNRDDPEPTNNQVGCESSDELDCDCDEDGLEDLKRDLMGLLEDFGIPFDEYGALQPDPGDWGFTLPIPLTGNTIDIYVPLDNPFPDGPASDFGQVWDFCRVSIRSFLLASWCFFTFTKVMQTLRQD